MWETEDLGPEDVLWVSTAFNGGIAGKPEAVCGAVSSGAVCLGLRHRTSDGAEQAGVAREAARRDAAMLAGDFADKFGSLICADLKTVDYRYCLSYVIWIVRRLYELGSV